MKHPEAFLVPLALAAAAVCAGGCAQLGYSVGSMLPKDIQSVFVPTVVNATDEPQLEIEVTQSVIEALQQDGSLRVVAEPDADAVLHARVIEYRLVPIAYRRDRATATEEYRVLLTASFQLTRSATDEVVAQSARVRGESTFELVGDLTSSKRLALPEAADDLAHDIVERIVEYW